MYSVEISAEKVNVDLENRTAILTGIDLSEIVNNIGYNDLLEEMDLSDVHDWVKKKLEEENGE